MATVNKREQLSSGDLANLNRAISKIAENNEWYGLQLRSACMARPQTFSGKTVEQDEQLLRMFIRKVEERGKMEE